MALPSLAADGGINKAPALSAHQLHELHLQHLANTGQPIPTSNNKPTAPTTNTVPVNNAPTTSAPSIPNIPSIQAPVDKAMPTAPTFKPFDFNYNYLNYDSAKKQAEDKYNPLFEQAVKGVQDQQYQNELNSGQSAAVRGLAHSGLAQDALTKLAIASQGQIAGLNAQKMSNVADMAQQLVDRDQSRGDALRGQMFNEYNSNRNFDYGQYRDNVGDVRYSNEQAYNKYRDQVGDQQWQSQFDYNKGRDNIADQRYTDETAYNRNRDTIGDQRYADETKYNRSQDALQQRNWQSQFDYGKSQDSLANQWKQKEWSQISPAELKRMAIDLANSMKLKKASDGGNGVNPYALQQPQMAQQPTSQSMPPKDQIIGLMNQTPGNNKFIGHPIAGSTADVLTRAMKEYADNPKMIAQIRKQIEAIKKKKK
jgi:hypothetical protein